MFIFSNVQVFADISFFPDSINNTFAIYIPNINVTFFKFVFFVVVVCSEHGGLCYVGNCHFCAGL